MKKIFFLALLMGFIGNAQCPEGLITSEQNLVKNGDFENGSSSFESEYDEDTSAGAGKFRITDDAYKFSSTYFKGKGEGNFMAVDGAQGEGIIVWSQKISVKKNTTYFFSCWVSNLLDIKLGPPAVLQFSINGKLLDVPFKCPRKLNKWEQFFVLWNSDGAEFAEIKVVSQNADWTGNDFGLDRIKFYECQETKLKIVEDKPVVLRNVLFDTNSAVILESSFSELNELVGYLKRNNTKKIAISGHTDNVGSDAANQKLSEARATSVMAYLVTNGIEESRLTAIGFGEEKPVDSNDTFEGRQKNRRVEFIFVK